MKNLLAFLAAAVIMFGGVGWYLDWFQIFNGPAAAGHHVFSVDLDAAKMRRTCGKARRPSPTRLKRPVRTLRRTRPPRVLPNLL
jgi:hypothetical protein